MKTKKAPRTGVGQISGRMFLSLGSRLNTSTGPATWRAKKPIKTKPEWGGNVHRLILASESANCKSGRSMIAFQAIRAVLYTFGSIFHTTQPAAAGLPPIWAFGFGDSRMARLSMNEMTTYRWSFDEDVAEYRSAGIPAIGVWRQKLSDYGEEKGIELLAEVGLPVSNLLWAGGFTGSDGRTFRESIADATEAIRLAAAMHARSLVVYSGGRAGHTHNHARRLLVDALKEIAPVAERANVSLAIEPMHTTCAAEWTFLTSLADTLSVLDAVASPSVQLAFDAYHFGADRAAIDLLPKLAGRIAVVHLADGHTPTEQEQNRTRLGAGSVPLGEVVAALRSAGYDGDYDVELVGPEIETSDYRELLRHSKAAFDELIRI